MDKEKAFLHHDIYPNAADIFNVDIKSIEDIKEDCIFIIDTNVLLLPYKTSTSSFEEIEKAFSKLIAKDQLLIPAQVAREFAKNRPEHLKTLFQQLNAVKSKISKPATGQYPLLESLTEYKEAKDIEKQIQELQKNYSKKIDNILENMKKWRWDDPVSAVYKELFKSNIIQELDLSQDELIDDLERRNKHNIPPGFKDKAKDDYGIGDLIIWRTILAVAKNKNKDIVFVSGDEKNDWFYRSDSQSLYPRFELITEFKNYTEDKTLHIIKSSKFLDILGAAEEAVTEVKIMEIELNENVYPLDLEGYQAEEAVYAWLKQTEGNKEIIRNNRFPDFIIEDFITKQGVEVISASNMSVYRLMRKINDSLAKGTSKISSKKMDSVRIVVVVPTLAYYHNLRVRKAEELDEIQTEEAQIVFGVVTEKGIFAKLI
ncbi:rRNA-processing protein FCF1 [Flavobacterium nitrogenifigens]|uniref:rRNA-processing protein FCF1 n=2 Tax=Flavobacterium TaxID=237 RepID=A0A7W7N7T2_9FLAO|nr:MULTISPECIES: PIN domain-containing protein [Flavobacterium]MBB4801799.1 rRNA-processing protein FCF1 [Flavobacterium nitrogenifigens]MBB6386757.1 rRNA-processing protein FCF1 [Flavobacterium notoginsengisoli]WDF58104.1 PIN domain-containing protein [Flavobacterium sp. KACC 22758]